MARMPVRERARCIRRVWQVGVNLAGQMARVTVSGFRQKAAKTVARPNAAGDHVEPFATTKHLAQHSQRPEPNPDTGNRKPETRAASGRAHPDVKIKFGRL